MAGLEIEMTINRAEQNYPVETIVEEHEAGCECGASCMCICSDGKHSFAMCARCNDEFYGEDQ